MRIKVRTVDAEAAGGPLEELDATAVGPSAQPEEEAARAPVTAADLGPRGEQVLILLGRAQRLTEAECRRLEEAAGWRWWSVTPLPTSTVAAARSIALLSGRRAGRAEAILALDAAVHQLIHAWHPTLGRRSRLPACIANAGLAVLLRDVIEPETFEMLAGPWLEVMHH